MDTLENKLIRSHRGGYCYEHNLLFATLLDQLGYRVTRLVAGNARDVTTSGHPKTP